MHNTWYNDKYPEIDWNQQITQDLDIESILENKTPKEIADKFITLGKEYKGIVFEMQCIPYNYGGEEEKELVGHYYTPKTEAEKEEYKRIVLKKKTASLKSQNTRLINLAKKTGLTQTQAMRHKQIKQELELMQEITNVVSK